MTTQKQKERMVKNIEGWGNVFNALLTSFKPFVVGLGTIAYNLVLVWMLFKEKLEVSDFIAAVGPMNMAIIGFWFSSKNRPSEKPPESAVKPDNPEENK